ncbi:MAG: hypothetical protein LQ345_006909, partial [Seirophora villosa]
VLEHQKKRHAEPKPKEANFELQLELKAFSSIHPLLQSKMPSATRSSNAMIELCLARAKFFSVPLHGISALHRDAILAKQAKAAPCLSVSQDYALLGHTTEVVPIPHDLLASGVPKMVGEWTLLTVFEF